MLNQFGQHIEEGDWVGWASKTGSCTHRKVGKVVSFGRRDSGYGRHEDTAIVRWLFDGTWGEVAEAIDSRSNGVGINRLFKLDPESFTEVPPF